MEDQASGSPGGKGFLHRLKRGVHVVAMFLLMAALAMALYAAFRFLPNRAVTYDTMEDHFKYGSTGGDLVTGIPFWLWQAMPLVCVDTLVEVAGDRLAPDYAGRVASYVSGDEQAPQRRALSREGYKALGFLYELDTAGRELDLPVGISQRRSLGLDRVYINCAICHTSTVREDEQERNPKVVLGMPANLFDLYRYEQFLFQCGRDGRPTQIPQLDFVAEIEALGGDLDIIDRYLVYPLTIWALRDVVHYLDYLAGFSRRQPEWGPGRNDTFTNNKVFAYGYDWRASMPDWHSGEGVDPEMIGTVDFPSTWLQGKRKTRADGRPMQLHWDGNNDKVEERNLNAALATSALPAVIDHEAVECIEQWMETLEPPPYRFPIDAALAEKGAPLYQRYCADCHGLNGRDFSGEKVGFVTHIDDIATDRYRLDNYTEALAQNMAMTYAGWQRDLRKHDCPGGISYLPPEDAYPESIGAAGDDSAAARFAAMSLEDGTYRYKHYRKTRGYANAPLDGIWLRAPYLHNGSVPTLRDLLRPAAQRPRVFYRGNDVYDPVDVGFVSTQPEDAQGRKFFLYDTTIPGNGNYGHEGRAYGTDLAEHEKNALIEYLKTF